MKDRLESSAFSDTLRSPAGVPWRPIGGSLIGDGDVIGEFVHVVGLARKVGSQSFS